MQYTIRSARTMSVHSNVYVNEWSTKKTKHTQIQMNVLDFSLLSAAVGNGTNIQYDRFIFPSKLYSFIAVSFFFVVLVRYSTYRYGSSKISISSPSFVFLCVSCTRVSSGNHTECMRFCYYLFFFLFCFIFLRDFIFLSSEKNERNIWNILC